MDTLFDERRLNLGGGSRCEMKVWNLSTSRPEVTIAALVAHFTIVVRARQTGIGKRGTKEGGDHG